MRKPPRLTLIRCNSVPNLSKDTLAFKVTIFESNHFDEVNLFTEDNCEYFYPPEDPDDYRSDMDYDHDLVADIDTDTLIRIVKFLKPQALITYTMRYGTTTSLFHHLTLSFTSSIQIGYIPTHGRLATLRMLLKLDKLPSLTASYRPISLMSSVLKLFEWLFDTIYWSSSF